MWFESEMIGLNNCIAPNRFAIWFEPKMSNIHSANTHAHYSYYLAIQAALFLSLVHSLI